MPVFSIWEARFPQTHNAMGSAETETTGQEMPICPGYLGHALMEDLDDPGHLLVISEWESREAADKVLTDYAGSPNARLANELVSEPRRRTVGRRLGPEKYR